MERSTPIYALTVVAVLGGAWYAIRSRRAPDPSGMTQYKVASVQRGTVRKTVSSTGSLQPWKTVDIKSKAGGRVDEMLVEVGTVVQKGQVIARIDPSDSLLTVDQARSDIVSGEARREQTAQQYAMQVRQSGIAVARAEAVLRAARQSRKAAESKLTTARRQAKAQPELTSAAIAQAQASYDQARKQRAQLDSTNAQETSSARSAYDQAVANGRNAETNLTRQKSLLAKGFVSQQTVDNAQATWDVSQAQVASARTRLDTLAAEQKASNDAADSRIQSALAGLRSAKVNAIDIQSRRDAVNEAVASLSQASEQVIQAEQALEEAKSNRANNAIKRLDITSAEASQTRNQAALKNASITLAQTTVRAPSDGVVLQKYVDQGTIITSGMSMTSSGSSIVQLGDTSRMYVDVTVDETDIACVDEGQDVEVSFDAYPGTPFEGRVARISPQAEVSQNVTMVHVRVEVDNASPTFRLLKPGMNATCDFIVDEIQDAVFVANTAVQTDSSGSYILMAKGGKPVGTVDGAASNDTLYDVNVTRRDVQVGVEGDENTEITSGLREGERIVVSTSKPVSASAARTSTSPIQSGGPGGGGPPPGPPPGG